MKVVAYLRVSTDRQAEHGLGLEVQEAACREWAKAHKHRLVDVVRDEGRSGEDPLRPGLAEALAIVKAGRAGGVVVYRVDRLARDLVLQEFLRAEFIKAGAELHSTSDVEDRYLNADPDDPSANLVRQILGAVAQYERAMITMRMQAGKTAKAARGGYQHGRPPYGYRAFGGELVPVAGEQKVIRMIQLARLRGESMRQIAAKLNDSGAKAPGGGVWSSQAVGRVVERLQTQTG